MRFWGLIALYFPSIYINPSCQVERCVTAVCNALIQQLKNGHRKVLLRGNCIVVHRKMCNMRKTYVFLRHGKDINGVMHVKFTFIYARFTCQETYVKQAFCKT